MQKPVHEPDFGDGVRFGKFTLAAKLGAGGSAEVWKAWDTTLGRWVALKLFRSEDTEDFARFAREAQAAAKLAHPHIASIYEVGEVEGRPYLAMQYVEGETLLKYPRRDRKALARIVRDAARAVGEAHRRGIVHRDLKPANLAVARHDSKPHVYVLDFGLARRIEGADKVTATGIVVGTPAYLPPEQARGEEVDGRADVYALGATLYQVLTGRPPFKGPNVFEVLRKVQDREPAKPRELNRAVEKDLETIVLKCLEKEPARRYATADELADDLDRWIEGEQIKARRASLSVRILRNVFRRKGMLVSAGAALLVICTTTGYLAYSDAVEHRKRDRARAYLESGRRILDQMRARMRDPYQQAEIEGLAERAEREFKLALLEHPEDAEALLGIGTAWTLAHSDSRAEQWLRQALNVAPGFASARLDLVNLRAINLFLLRLGPESELAPESEEARRLRREIGDDLQRVKSETRDHAELHLSQGILAMAEHAFDRAVDHFTRYLQIAPADFRAYNLRGASHFYAGRFAEAVQDADLAIACNRSSSALFNLRSGAKRALGLLDAAIDDLQRALEISPDEASLYVNLSWLLDGKNLHEETIKSCDRAIALDPNSPSAYLSRGRSKSRLGRVDEAIADHVKAIEWAPTSAAAHCGMGTVMLEARRIEEAIAHFTKALEFNPKHGGSLCGLIMAKEEAGVPFDVVGEYDRVVSLDPRCAQAFNNRGFAKARMGRHEWAFADFDQAVQLDPTSALAWTNRGFSHHSLGRFREAIRDHTRSIMLDPKFAWAYSNRACAQEKLGLLEDAIGDCTKAIELDAKLAPAYANRANARLGLGQLEEAHSDIKTSIELKPHVSDSWHTLASVRFAMGSMEDAGAACAKALELNPENLSALVVLGNVKSMTGDLDGAVADYERALLLDGKSFLAYFNRGRVRLTQSRIDEAIADFTRALDVNPKSPDAWFERGTARRVKGEPAAALADFTKSIEVDPKNSRALINRGNTHADLGRLDDAIVDYTKAIELDPGNPLAWSNRGGAWALKGLYEAAFRDCLKAIALDPQLPEAHHNLGAAKLARKEFKEAIDCFDKALELRPAYTDALFNRGEAQRALRQFDKAKADYAAALKVAAGKPSSLAKFERCILMSEAGDHSSRKEYSAAIAKFKDLLFRWPEGTHAQEVAMNIAACYALLGNKSEALDWLETSVAKGFMEPDKLAKDPDLESLRGEARFKMLLEELKR